MPRKKLKDSHAEIASLNGVAPDDVEALKKQIKDLEGKLEVATAGRTEEELSLLASLQGIASLANEREVATGKFVKVRRLANYKVVGYRDEAGGREILRAQFKTVELPTYFYKVNLPPCGGTHLMINGLPVYHNATIEFDIDTLRTVKDMVYRCWAHDREIHGTDENFYRKTNRDVNPQNTISMRMTG